VRAISILSIPVLFLVDNLVFKISTGFTSFASYFIVLIVLAFLSSVAWLFFLNFIAKNLSYLEKGRAVALNEYVGYLIAFLFIPIGIFIVQPILNKLRDDSSNSMTTH
jgi:large-conductance mechanosensitive channel